MPPKTAFFTICSGNYLAYALTLGQSLSKTEPNTRLHVFLVDRLPASIAVPDQQVEIVGIDKLALDNLDEMAFRYSITELNTAVKPFCFDYLFDVLHYDAAIYLDPDTLVLNPLEHVRLALEAGESCVLTPHITQGLKDGRHPDEDTFLTVGVFNLGFAAFTNVPESRSFISWWGEKTRRDCIVAIDRGIFVDQSYCNLAPCFIDRFHALRNPGYNIAYWNLSQRNITRNRDHYFIDGEPVRFMHFSGIEPHDPTSFSKHQNRFARRDIGVLKPLVDRYVADLTQQDRHSSGRFSQIPYSFGFFHDGRPINNLFRFVYRRYQDDRDDANPFDLKPSFFNATAKDYKSFEGLRLSRLYVAAWEQRVDLQRAFDLDTPNGQANFLNWAIDGLPRDYGLSAPFLLPTTTNQSAVVPARVLNQQQRNELLDRAITSRAFMLRNLLRRQLLGEHRVRDYWERRLGVKESPPRGYELSPGLDVYGFFTAETGVGQAARGFVKALKKTTVNLNCHTLNAQGFANTVAFKHPNSVANYDTTLICANADFVANLDKHIDPERLVGRRKLTHWAWELPVFPAAWAAAFNHVDEVWTASRFVARSVKSATHKVVRVVPYVVQATDVNIEEARSELTLPQESYIFLTVFDLNSYSARKNPLAVIRAFQAAFTNPKGRSPLLIVKFHGHSQSTEFRQILAEAIAGDPRIMVIDAVYSAAQMSWLRSACDAFVSLHRSEGFGLNIAEAMAAGKLAIATHFSGNEDFMTQENSIPIQYKMSAVGKTDYPHGAGQWWAEPDHDAAVEAMRWAVDHAGAAEQLMQRGKEDVRSAYSKEAVSHVIYEALDGRSVISID